ncbi:MAG: hypothetical protein IKP23_01650 [Elusimicrobiaceae bacterium]|nr:hypothetical protein [Elusimicrobiaceae bacterium]
MKKLTILAISIILLIACGGNKNTKTNTSKSNADMALTQLTTLKTTFSDSFGRTDPNDAVSNAILTSDLDTFKQYYNSLEAEKLNDYLSYAAGICDPFRRRGRKEPVAARCQKDNNTEIIRMLIAKGAKGDYINFVKKEGYSLYLAKTLASNLKEWNPGAVKYMLAGLDKCLVALTQMQGADTSKSNYYVYADFWRDNNCSTKNYKKAYGRYNKGDKELFALIGASKETILNQFGQTPTIHERPSEHREVLTYKTAEEREYKYSVSGKQGVASDYSVEEYHYIFTIDRGVVTQVEKIFASKTDGKGQTKEIDQEKLKQSQKNLEESHKGQVAEGRLIRRFSR